MALPKVLKAYQCSIDGRGYAGKADVTLPDLSVVTEEYAAGGMSAKVKLDMGLIESLDAKFTLYEYAPEVLALWGLVDGGRVPLVFRGGALGDSGDTQQIKVSMRGQIHVVSGGSWTAGAKAQMECTLNCRSYKLEIDGVTLIEIDAERMVRVIGGVDQMAALRGMIGV